MSERGSAKKYKQGVVYEYLKNAIITGKLPQEKQLIEQDICDKLQVSRTPVREAFRQLTSEGLLDFSPGRGVVVASITKEKAVQMYELKEALEGMAARLCAQRADEADIKRMESCIELHKAAYMQHRTDMATDVDLQFHICLLECAGSPMVEKEGKALLTQARRLSQLSVYDGNRIDVFIRQHQDILEAIRRKDPDGAYKAVSEHIHFVEEFQWKRWEMLF